MAKDRFKAGSQRKKMQEHGHENARAGPGPVPFEAAAALRTLGYRTKTTNRPDIDGPVKEIAGYALERTLEACAGKIDDKSAPAVLKAAKDLREEMCEPVEKVSTIKGSLTLEQLVAKANEPEEKK